MGAITYIACPGVDRAAARLSTTDSGQGYCPICGGLGRVEGYRRKMVYHLVPWNHGNRRDVDRWLYGGIKC